MKTFSRFFFESYHFDTQSLQATFCYSFDENQFFEEVVQFRDEHFSVRMDLDMEVIDAMMFQISLALGVSYYKLQPVSELIVKTGKLTSDQCHFWKKFYTLGLGEFLYTHDLSPDVIGEFSSVSEEQKIAPDFPVSHRSLVPLGGGKDSLVTIELSREHYIDFDTVVFGKMDAIKSEVAKYTGVKNLCIRRQISPELPRMNAAGYLNGHVPITGMISFVLVLTAYLYDYDTIVMSNERSANFGNTLYEGLEVNHQYSKSFEYEQDFKAYLEETIGARIQYFSLLRPMYELKIAKIFSETCEKYFPYFSSCNANFKITHKKDHSGNWCGKCPKCLFVYALLHSFLGETKTTEIFGHNLYTDILLETGFKDLVGLGEIKPFECVGEEIEVLYAMRTSIDVYVAQKQELPIVLYHLERGIAKKLKWVSLQNLQKSLFKNYDEHIIPKAFQPCIERVNP